MAHSCIRLRHAVLLTTRLLVVIENTRMSVNTFYSELRIFEESHVLERNIPCSQQAFNRSAFAARIVTHREAVERIASAMEEANLQYEAWPSEMKVFDPQIGLVLEQPMCKLPSGYTERNLRGGRASLPIVDPPAAVRRAAAQESDEEDKKEPATPELAGPAAGRAVRRSANPKGKKKTPARRLGRAKEIILLDGSDLKKNAPELNTDMSHARK